MPGLKAVILAGGFGTRVRPLSCTRPKMLFPVANQPLLDWTLEKLAKSKIEETVLAVNYMVDAFTKRYGERAYGMKISLSKDLDPTQAIPKILQRSLGTGGAIKKAEKLIGLKEPFLVLNGDILTNINYAEIAKKHKAGGAIATIALHEVEDPSRYGVVKLTKEGRIIRFVEKPSREKAPSNLVNAGIYSLSPEIFDYIPDDRPVSIEREIFPKLAEEGRLYSYNFHGYWIDIGKPSDYLKANQLLLDMETKKEELSRNVALKSEVLEPCIIGKNVVMGSKSKIGPYVAIGEDVVVGKEVRIENSIIYPRTIVSDFTSIRGAIVGEGSMIGRKVRIESGCVVGDYVMLRDNVTLTKGVTVCPHRDVRKSVLTPKCLM